MEKFAVEVESGHAVKFDLKKLLVSRALIVANSGGGKSHAIRKLAEVTHGHVQQIILDTEGEFASLRERYDYVYAAGVGGDALAHPRTAKLLAERLLETGVSAIIDIYELKPHERHTFVRIFLDAMTNAPKSLWHPVLVILDEAHVYAPEAEKSEAHGAVADIATRGRKRGFCLVAATQRLAKLSKDVAAELNNKLIGRMSLDVDVKRAAQELGMTPAVALPMLRGLEAGDFFTFGPALSMDIRKIHTGEVQTRHHKSGEKYVAPPKPTAAILAVLPKLADLPKESEEQAKSLEDLRRENASLKRELAKKPAPAAVANAPQLFQEYQRGFTAGDVAGRKAVFEKLKSIITPTEKHVAKALSLHIESELKNWMEGIRTACGLESKRSQEPPKTPSHGDGIALMSSVHPQRASGPMRRPDVKKSSLETVEIDLPPSAPQQRILDALLWLKVKGITAPTKQAVGAVAGASPKSSSFANNLGALRSAGLISYDGQGGVSLTAEGEANAVPPNDDRELIECWKSIVTGPQAKILETLRDNHPEPISKEDVAVFSDASASSSSFANNLGALRTLGAIDYPRPGYVALTKHAMPE